MDSNHPWFAGVEGFEPTTNRLTVYCSNHLSYTPIKYNSNHIAKIPNAIRHLAIKLHILNIQLLCNQNSITFGHPSVMANILENCI